METVLSPAGEANDLVALAVHLAEAGTARAGAVDELVAATRDRRVLQAAHLRLVRRMHRLPSDDFTATEALAIILGALRVVPFDRR